MEHRWSGRKLCQRGVTIESPLSGPVLAVTRDIGPDGIFVETTELRFRINEPVYVALNLQDNACSALFPLEAMVVRNDRDGVALMFLDVPPEVLARLQRLLNPLPPSNVEQNQTRPADPPRRDRRTAFALNY
jgi:hypothetical protein